MNRWIERLDAEEKRNAEFQNAMNAQFALTRNAKQTRQEIREYADDAHKEYPQYAGHWDEFELVRIGSNVRTKVGTAFKQGDVALGKYESGLGFAPGRWIVYSVRNGVDTSLGYSVHRID